MNYVMSDLHGFYDKYQEFMRQVAFSDDDTLYIVGDLLDRGPDGIKLMQDVMERKNVVALKGNHEMMMYPILEDMCGESPAECQEIIIKEMAICNIGQAQTLHDFMCLGRKKQWRILNFISSMPLYMAVTAGSNEFLLVHGGLPDYKRVGSINCYKENELLFGPHDYSVEYFDDATVIVGHQPTRFIPGARPDVIYRSNGSVNIDCGLGFGGQLGVLCLDTDEELYF